MGTKDTKPEFLYKYRSVETPTDKDRVKQIITDCQIYYPKPDEINDPYDCRMPSIQSYGQWPARAWMVAQKAKTDDERIQIAHKYEPKLLGRSAEELAELNKASSST